MGIFARIARLIKANLNALISGAEDPEKVLTQILEDMGSQLMEAKKQVAVAIADEKRLAKQAQAVKEKVDEWERRPMLAVRAGNDELAKEALARKAEIATLSDQYLAQWQKQKASVEQLKLALAALHNHTEEYSGDTLALKFSELSATAGAEEDLVALKRKMGMLPPEPAPQPTRVESTPSSSVPLDAAEEEELARALADLEAEEQRSLQAK